MNEEEEFDGSALRELLTPVVADRGATTAPTDAIVAAGRRRVVGRRVAVAGSALAIVAAVPVAATAIAAGPDKADTATAPAVAAKPMPTATPTHAATTPPTSPTAPARTSSPTAPNPARSLPVVEPNAPLPAKPLLLGSGTLDGKHWSVSAVGSAGNNALTAKDNCLKLLTSEDGQATDPSLGDHLLYCLPGVAQGYRLEELAYEIKNGAGSLAVGTVSADVTKIVAHVQGVSAPFTITTVPAPGAPDTAIFIVPVPADNTTGIILDEYNAAGVKVGTFDNSKPMGMQ